MIVEIYTLSEKDDFIMNCLFIVKLNISKNTNFRILSNDEKFIELDLSSQDKRFQRSSHFRPKKRFTQTTAIVLNAK